MKFIGINIKKRPQICPILKYLILVIFLIAGCASNKPKPIKSYDWKYINQFLTPYGVKLLESKVSDLKKRFNLKNFKIKKPQHNNHETVGICFKDKKTNYIVDFRTGALHDYETIYAVELRRPNKKDKCFKRKFIRNDFYQKSLIKLGMSLEELNKILGGAPQEREGIYQWNYNKITTLEKPIVGYREAGPTHAKYIRKYELKQLDESTIVEASLDENELNKIGFYRFAEPYSFTDLTDKINKRKIKHFPQIGEYHFKNGIILRYDINIDFFMTFYDWERFLEIKNTHIYEDVKRTLRLFDFDGKQLNKSLDFFGHAVIFEPFNRIIVFQNSSHHQVNKSYLLDKNGKILKIINQSPNAFKISYSKDYKVFWILSEGLEDGVPFTRAEIFNFNGEKINTIKSKKKESKEVQFRGKMYMIGFPQPKIPG